MPDERPRPLHLTDRWPVYCALCLAGRHEDCQGATSWCECLSDLCLPREDDE